MSLADEVRCIDAPYAERDAITERVRALEAEHAEAMVLLRLYVPRPEHEDAVANFRARIDTRAKATPGTGDR